MMHFLKKRALVLAATLTLAILPFFWTKPGELNIGGDGSSIYFYDPINVIKHFVLYKIFPYGTGPIEVRYFYLPFVTVLALLKSLFPSYVLSILLTSIKLSVGFLAMYGIMKELLSQFKEKTNKIEVIALLTGIFYIFSPLLTKEDRFINPIPSHDQVFLNPFIFYLVLKYFLTRKMRYLWSVLIITVIFSTSFSYSSAPALFSFYPFAFLFIIFYVLVILKRTLPIKGIVIGIVFFILLHLFHLGPEIANLFDPSSDISTRVFSKEDYKQQVVYFYGVIGFASLPKSILLPSVTNSIWLAFAFLSPLIVLLGFLKNKAKSKLFLLTGLFFLVALFFISAKVTHIGVKFYESLFLYVPGFGMFRNFYIQWLFVYTFFYALMFGQALFLLYGSLGKTKVKLISLVLFVYLIGSAWTFIKGDQFNLAHVQSNNVQRQIVMDPQYEKMLQIIRNAPFDGKILQFPFSDFNFQVVHGTGDGAYVGTPTIGQLTGVKDFAGYWNIAPYSEAFLQFGKEKDYAKLSEIIGLLNIRYIFHNADTKIYDTTFFGRPFEYTRQFLPSTQKEYEEFIKPLVGEKLFESGPYRLYLTDEASYIPHVYIPKETIVYEYNPKYDRYYHAASSFLIGQERENTEKRIAYIEKNDCMGKPPVQALCSQNTSFDKVPKIFFKKINPVKYMVKVTDAQNPFLLVFSDAFHRDWKLFLSEPTIKQDPVIKTYFNGDIEEGEYENIFFNKKTFETLALQHIPEIQHITVNAYANAWYLTPRDIGMKQESSFIIEMTGQRMFYATSIISLLTLCGFILWGAILFFTKKF